jgi:hypothetical protein
VVSQPESGEITTPTAPSLSVSAETTWLRGTRAATTPPSSRVAPDLDLATGQMVRANSAIDAAVSREMSGAKNGKISVPCTVPMTVRQRAGTPARRSSR